jgi:hypothetical protein
MAERSWFIVMAGKQEGPFPESQLRAFIASGRVTAETLIWSDGMAEWQRAGEVPGLIAAASPPPPRPPPTPLPGSTRWPAVNRGGSPASAPAGAVGGSLSADFSVFGLFGRALLVVIGTLFIIPAPWVMTSFYRWFISHIRAPQILAPGFAGQPGDIWWAFILIALCSYAGLPEAHAHAKEQFHLLPLLIIPAQAALGWVVLRWLVAKITSAGQLLGLQFNGSVIGYIGWTLLLYVSFITIIGWAWVTTAWMRWIAANVHGTPGPVVFNASGWSVLWRTFAVGLGCMFIIPIPWLIHWYARWYVSQFAIAARPA